MNAVSKPPPSARRVLLTTLFLTLVFGSLVTGTLWRHLGDGIPWVYYRGDLSAEQYMRPGDHLQLLGRFVLADHMLRGEIPAYSNVYEFNRGDDAARRRVGPYYVPFSLLFAFFARLGSWAFAWNLLGFLSLWLTMLFTFLLLRRFAGDRIALLSASVTVLNPYRLENLLGGAPSGFSLLWVPLLFWGLDAMTRDGRRRGGVAAGLALWGAAWTDTQTFFFMAMAAPLWVVLRLWVFPATADRWPVRLRRAVRAGLPGLPLLLPAALALFAMRGKIEGSFHMAGGREIRELLLYSPPPSALFSLDPGQPVQVYLGYAWLFLMVAGVVALAVLFLRPGPRPLRLAALWLVFAGATLAIVWLALGLYGPFGGLPIRVVRKLVPVFRSVRAPPKIYCLMPTAMAVGAVLSLRTLIKVAPRYTRFSVLLFVVLLVLENTSRARPGICLLDDAQGAYAAVLADAGDEATPRAIVLPLWPGDSHWASVYIHHAMHYRIRLLNGYSPVVDRDYVHEVFQRFRGLNAGAAAEGVFDELRGMGIHYLLLHEDLFPERVSPAPVAHTLDRLLRHPRLDFLARDRSVWAFRIRETESDRAAPPAAWATGPALPSFRFHAGHLQTEDERRRVHRTADSPDATHDVFVRMEAGGDTFQLPRFSSFDAPGRRLWLRVRGRGRLRAEAVAEDTGDWSWREDADVDSTGWEWVILPFRAPADYDRVRARLAALEGTVDVDAGLMITGDWSPALPPEGVEFPAAAFFRAGYTDPETGDVRLEPLRVDEDRIFYGPRLPLAPGDYVAELRYVAEGAFAHLGEWGQDVPRPAAGRDAPRVPVLSNAAIVRLNFRQTDNRWVEFGYRYSGEGPVVLRSVRIRPATISERIQTDTSSSSP